MKSRIFDSEQHKKDLEEVLELKRKLLEEGEKKDALNLLSGIQNLEAGYPHQHLRGGLKSA